MAKVTLIRPALVSSAASYSNPITPPLGLAYLGAMLLKDGHQIQAIDAIGDKVDQFIQKDGYLYQGLSIPETIEKIADDADAVGVSCMFTQDWPFASRLVSAIRGRFPKMPIVAGGEHITALPEFSMQDCPAIDYCALGEGEESIADLVKALGSGGVESVPGMVLRREGRIERTEPRRRIRAVDEIPWPAWDLFPMEVYLASTNGHGVYLGRNMPILSTRGCPYECTFCSNPVMYGNAWIARKPEAVLEEIEHYLKTYRAKNIDFYDLTMILKKSWILDFCRMIEERKLDFTWQLPSGTRSEVIDEEVSAALYRTGCRNVTYAPESGSNETLIKIKKKVHLPKVRESIRAAIKNGISVKCNLIVGFPHESLKNIVETIWFSWQLAWLGVADVAFFIFSPYPGSELFEQVNAENLKGKYGADYFRSLTAYMDFTESSAYCKNLSPRELSFWRFLGMSAFYALSFLLRPWRFIKLMVNIARNKSDTVLEQRLGAIVHRPNKLNLIIENPSS